MSFEEKYRAQANRFLIAFLACHLPVYMAVGAYFATGVLTALVLGLLILAGPAALYFYDPAGVGTSLSVAISSMGMSALLIHLGHGMIEFHFHIFTMLALL